MEANHNISSQLNTQKKHKFKIDKQIDKSQDSKLLKSEAWWNWIPLGAIFSLVELGVSSSGQGSFTLLNCWVHCNLQTCNDGFSFMLGLGAMRLRFDTSSNATAL